MSFRHHRQSQDIQVSLDHMHRSLDTYGLDRNSTVLIGSCCLACVNIRAPRDIDVLVSPQEFETLHDQLATPSGIPLKPLFHTDRPWLYAVYRPQGVMSLDITRPADFLSTDEVLDELFQQEMANLPQTDEGWHYLTAELALEAMARSHARKNRQDIKQLKKNLEAQ
ncbi:hypothetical protein RAAC3_TM7C00001G0575 [Candidatus Saccharibacteria bacterium RAAC3_TM7_1]|nr:hypothetical protein RAAC3_TM7C00001G0575 [Candidatus Saccharibacteria bacterium RAAC3_TM7_1]HCZ28430.1 hypothetical protein [Candidatus Saccharibacteria bacterium]